MTSPEPARRALPPAYLQEVLGALTERPRTKREIAVLKTALASKHGLGHIPTDYELLLHAPEDISVRKQLLSKPVRTQSGVAVIAIMTEPRACSHGVCIMCPGGPNSFFGSVPQSYTGNEPASMRAARNNYDAYLQVFNRIEQYLLLGHEPGKVELIIMGGTFPSYPLEYQYHFVTDALAAMNDFSETFFKQDGNLDHPTYQEFFELPGKAKDKERAERIRRKVLALKDKSDRTSSGSESSATSTIEDAAREQERNERARIRCVAMCVETKPDYSKQPHIDHMLAQGTTRVELGVQSLSDQILSAINRGHTLQDSVEATAMLKDAFLKVGHHMMPGLPGSTPAEDIAMFRELFENADYRPDSLKIYPCLVMPGTPLERLYNKGEFTPLSMPQAARIIAEAKRRIPEYCRIMRVQRDIPSTKILAGAKYTNLRQEVQRIMRAEGWNCRCLRCREPHGRETGREAPQFRRFDYEASGGQEIFLALESNDMVLGYCRVRLPWKPFRPEIGARTCGVRELHVFGAATPLGEKGDVQHRGTGSRLLSEAERIAAEDLDAKEILVISGIGVLEYYARFGYQRKGPYMAKTIK